MIIFGTALVNYLLMILLLMSNALIINCEVGFTFFLCPSRTGLQEMLDIAQKYVKDHIISFSTDPEPKKSKTKGIIFTRKPLKFSPLPLILNGNPLP